MYKELLLRMELYDIDINVGSSSFKKLNRKRVASLNKATLRVYIEEKCGNSVGSDICNASILLNQSADVKDINLMYLNEKNISLHYYNMNYLKDIKVDCFDGVDTQLQLSDILINLNEFTGTLKYKNENALFDATLRDENFHYKLVYTITAEDGKVLNFDFTRNN